MPHWISLPQTSRAQLLCQVLNQLHCKVKKNKKLVRLPSLTFIWGASKTPVEKSTKEVFHTLCVNDQHVTKKHGTEATNEEDGSLPEFDEMADVDIIYRQGVPYLFDAETAEGKVRKPNIPTSNKSRRHNPLILLMLCISPR